MSDETSLELVLLQSDADAGDAETSAARLRRLAGDASADAADAARLLVTPELALSGYDLRERFEHCALPLDRLASLDLPTPLLVSLAEAAPDGRVHNTAALVGRDGARAVHRKLYLPTYGMFDEARYFAPGERIRPFDHAGWRIGSLICEDFWHPGLLYALASAGADLIVVQAAGAGRGVWNGGQAGPFASWDVWIEMARVAARSYAVYVAIANRAGAEGGAVFAGGSVIIGPDGATLASGRPIEEDVVRASLTRDALVRARRPYSHLRDDDPGVVAEALAAARADRP